MLLWMLSALLFALVIGVAAHGAAKALVLLRRPSRSVWVIAVLAAIGWPVLAPLLIEATPVALSPQGVHGDIAEVLLGLTERAPNLPGGASHQAEVVLAALWLIASGILLLRLAHAQRALSRLASRAQARRIDGHAVVITDSLGPAAFGLFPGRIALSVWVAELDAPLRSLIIRHEQAHCDARTLRCSGWPKWRRS